VRRFVVFVTVVLVAVSPAVSAVAPAIAQPPPVVLRPPVDAEVSDPFRPPASDYGPGNLGLEYATEPGAVVVAAAPGIVVFAGPVAGRVWVTVDHGAGLRTSYGPVAGLRVSSGDRVHGRQPIATATGPLHFGTRVDDVHVDPASLLGVFEVRVRLVPHDTDDAEQWLRLAEHEERIRILIEHGGGFDWREAFRVAIGVGSGLLLPIPQISGWEERADALIHTGEVFLTLGEALDTQELVRGMATGLRMIADPLPCTTPAGATALAPPRGRRRIAVLVDGLDSSSGAAGALAALDLEALGYDRGDIVRHSYQGGLVPGGGEGWGIERSGYEAGATRADVEPQIDGLAASLRLIAAANPGVEIDLYGHSLGGLIARHASVAVDGEVPLGVAITFAAPHAGAPLAEFVEALELTGPGTVASMLARHGWEEMVLVAPALEDLSESGFAGDTRAVAFPEGVHAVTIGARADLVVPATMASAPGARHVVVGDTNPVGAHTDLVGRAEVETEVRLALAGLPPLCTDTTDAVLDLVVPEAIAYGQHAAALAVLIADLPGG